MRGSRIRRCERRLRVGLAAALTATTFSGCLSSDIAKRFREVYGPGLAAGLTTAVTEPGAGETGLRMTWAALNEALAAVISNRTGGSTSEER